jgi:hypothetical protein
MATEPAVPKITLEDLQKINELTSQISAFRNSLKPRYEAISKELENLTSKTDILALMEFEGKTSFKIKVEWDKQTIEILFKIGKIGG